MMTLDQVKNKSSARMIGLHPVVLDATTVLIERCYTRGVPILITQGLRTIAEQDALYAQGRTKPGAVVTNARGGYSYHNFGLAVDFALLLPNGSSVSWDMRLDGNNNQIADWQEVVKEAKALGFEWGGDWTSFKDYPHFQMVFGLTLTQLRTGIKPSEIAMAKATAVIDRLKEEVNEDMSKIEELEQVIAKQDGRIAALEKRLNISGKETYAKDYEKEILAAKDAGIITSSAEKSKLELNVITMLVNAGLANKALISFFKNFKADVK
ncbi:peptidoglycan L-alanyl-D-glutamate endopeptidase CwlK [Paenibacillus sp. PastF-3]|uniref:M15 family metallopeptidase n=1 Tax=Paenibacillus sp. PastF-3 TaxID=2940626 RepID=UPI002476FFF4|nr:M15 family metallopeptidase [Paenibacillus sp. PastF-3]MDH6373509.1 peptidoglycan L-alanyl-D-glutamate endopeptidase CwlK [Paenibacillus sp. PastF-3]